MNILELAGFHSNYGSNFVPSIENLGNNLCKKGHKVFYIFSNKNLSEKFLEWEVPFSKRYPTTLLNFSSPSFVRQTVSFIKRNNIKVVHAHFCSSFYLSMIKRRCPKDVLFLEHIHSCPYNNKKTFRAFLKRVRNFVFLEKDIVKVCVSNGMMPMVKYTFPGQNVICCVNAVDFSRLSKSSRNNCDGFDLLLLGHNYYVKGVDIAIKAVLAAKKYIKEIRLDIIMGDNFEANKKKIIREFGGVPDCVRILEPTHDICPVYMSHSVSLNASRSEGRSYAVVESYYCGSLCILSDIPGNVELGLSNVIYFSMGDEKDLARAILQAYKVKDSYSNNVDEVEKNLSIENWSCEIIHLMGL